MGALFLLCVVGFIVVMGFACILAVAAAVCDGAATVVETLNSKKTRK